MIIDHTHPRWSACSKTVTDSAPPPPAPDETNKPLSGQDEKGDSEEASVDSEEPPQSLVFTSEGGAAEYSGFCLGQFTLVEDFDQLVSDSRQQRFHLDQLKNSGRSNLVWR